VNQALARRVFGGDEAVGKSVIFTYKAGNPPIRIVGVVADQRTTLDEEAPPAIFLPFDQDSTTYTTIFLRTAATRWRWLRRRAPRSPASTPRPPSSTS